MELEQVTGFEMFFFSPNIPVYSISFSWPSLISLQRIIGPFHINKLEEYMEETNGIIPTIPIFANKLVVLKEER